MLRNFRKLTLVLMLVLSSSLMINANDDMAIEFDVQEVEERAEEFQYKEDITDVFDVELEPHDHILENAGGPQLFSAETLSDYEPYALAKGVVFADLNNRKSSSSTVNVFLSATGDKAYSYLGSGGQAGVFLIIGEKGARYQVMISGLNGWINKSDITNVSTHAKAKSHNYYEVIDGELYHFIARGLNQTAGTKIVQGKITADYNLKPGNKYLSYDGRYFYPDTDAGIRDMIDDYLKISNTANLFFGTNPKSLNKNKPYVNYFMWLPVRTQSKLTPKDMANYLGHSDPSVSRLVETEQFFIDYGEYYGTNPALAFSTGVHESGFGTSKFSKQRNNYFGHNAVDSDPNKANLYNSPAQGIGAHIMDYFNRSYLNQNDYRFFGSFVGNKDMGMNVKYASDPYWGEKISAHYYNMDKKAGFKDYGRYTIATVKNSKAQYYKDAKGNKSYQSKYSGIPLSITSESGKYYGFLSDMVLDSNKNALELTKNNMHTKYLMNTSTLYIDKNDVNVIYKGTDSKLVPQSTRPLPEAEVVATEAKTVYMLDNVHLRPDWSPKYTSVLTIPKDTQLTGYLTSNGWVQLVYNGHIGYVSGDFVSYAKGGKPLGTNSGDKPSKPLPPVTGKLPEPGNTPMYTTGPINLRDKPVNGKVLTTVPKDNKVITGKPLNGWVHVSYGSYRGYMSYEYLTSKDPNAKPPAPARKLGDINNDGIIDGFDMMAVKRHWLGGKKLSGIDFKAGDINGDNVIDGFDMMDIKRHWLGGKQIKGDIK